MKSQANPKKILFVCLGNICRSPLAEGIAQTCLEKKGIAWEADSAGTSGWHEGEPPCENAIKVAKIHGIEIAHQRSRPVNEADKDIRTRIVALDRKNLADLKAQGFSNVHLLGDFGGFGGEDVPDPYYFPGFEGFEKVYSMIETCVHDFIEKVENGSL